jgi:hypothetical protein
MSDDGLTVSGVLVLPGEADPVSPEVLRALGVAAREWRIRREAEAVAHRARCEAQRAAEEAARWCKAHPDYRPVARPEVVCEHCWFLWFDEQAYEWKDQ